jgi:hypothetical protein
MCYEAMSAFGVFEGSYGKTMPCRCKTFNGSHKTFVSSELKKQGIDNLGFSTEVLASQFLDSHYFTKEQVKARKKKVEDMMSKETKDEFSLKYIDSLHGKA